MLLFEKLIDETFFSCTPCDLELLWFGQEVTQVGTNLLCENPHGIPFCIELVRLLSSS